MKVNNEDLLPAFYFALQDTLVAKDMEQATRIAFGARRFRVVTLGGGMIEASGAMSGTRLSRMECLCIGYVRNVPVAFQTDLFILVTPRKTSEKAS